MQQQLASRASLPRSLGAALFFFVVLLLCMLALGATLTLVLHWTGATRASPSVVARVRTFSPSSPSE